MNVLNVPDIERELARVASHALHPAAKQWVASVPRNYLLSRVSDKDSASNFRVYNPAKPGLDMPALLPDWALDALRHRETLHWFDPIQVRRRPFWQVLEHIVNWFNSWSATDTRLPRLTRINFQTATNASALWMGNVNRNLWDFVKDKPPVIRSYEDDYHWVRLVTNLHFERESKLMNHCFSGSTEVITNNGTVPISELSGKVVKVLTRHANGDTGKWVEAYFSSYGKQRLFRIDLMRRNVPLTIWATEGHRWFGQKNKNSPELVYRTDDLKPGMRLPTLFSQTRLFHGEKKVHLSPVGVMHGIVFEDGTRARHTQGETDRPARITLYGTKDAQLLKWFPEASQTKPITRSIGGIQIDDLPRYFKKLPPLNECPAYLLGWLAGYFAADGKVFKYGGPCLDSACLDNLKFVDKLCQRFGIRTVGIKSKVRLGFGTARAIYSLVFEVGSLPDYFFLLKAHRNRAIARTHLPAKWIVKSVSKTDRVEEVFCAKVPETHCFVLKGNLLTGNCVGNGHYYSMYRRGDMEYYSLRDKHNNPHCTVEVAIAHGQRSVNQCKGNSNQKAAPCYQKFIRRFFNDMQWPVNGDSHFID